MWDERFEVLLRQHLPFLDPDEELVPDLNLRDFGLDSIGVVDLLVSLESAYDVRVADAALSMETFERPAILWNALSSAHSTAI